MQNPFLLALFLIAVALFITFYVVSAAFYHSRHETKYHFYQMFPYEFNYPSFFKFNIYGNILMVAACGCVIAFYGFNPIDSFYSLIALVLSIVITMFIIVLLLFPIRYLRTHMIVSSLLMTLSAALPLFNFFTALIEMKAAFETLDKALCIISMSISAVLAISMLVLIINPKLTYTIYLDKTLDEEGNEVLQRPRVIFAALNEWWSIFLFFLSPLGLLFLLIL